MVLKFGNKFMARLYQQELSWQIFDRKCRVVDRRIENGKYIITRGLDIPEDIVWHSLEDAFISG